MTPDDALLAAWPSLYGRSPGDRALAAAQALVSSPPWVRLRERARIAVRRQPVPAVALVGRLEPGDRAAVEALGWQVTDSLERLLPVTYDEVERACAVLATRLQDQLGTDRLRRSRIVGLPRGGLVVAGMLSYALDLGHDQLSGAPDGRETVVVDDCMLSGSRVRRWLSEHEGPAVVLAHLHSHPAARLAAEADPRVSACVAAADLTDHAPARHGEGYEAWRRRWAERSPDDYWTGHPDHVCYPWNEPDTVFWNDSTGVAEPGWHVVPPQWCLKNRSTAADQEIQRCDSPHVPADVMWVALDDVVVLLRPGGGESVELTGVGVDFWQELVKTGSPEAAADGLADTYAVAPEVLRGDVQAFAESLRRSGWWGPAA